jgi:hypothetical protein
VEKGGAFNFSGEVNKVLFGTMDDEDAKYYNEQIKHFEKNSDDITKLLKQQLIVVKSSLGSVNGTLTDMEYNQKECLMQVKNHLRVQAVTAENREKLNMVGSHQNYCREPHCKGKGSFGYTETHLGYLIAEHHKCQERNFGTTNSISKVDFGCFNTEHASFS